MDSVSHSESSACTCPETSSHWRGLDASDARLLEGLRGGHEACMEAVSIAQQPPDTQLRGKLERLHEERQSMSKSDWTGQRNFGLHHSHF